MSLGVLFVWEILFNFVETTYLIVHINTDHD